ncbi:hypothetical protein V565_325120 [Rhizoctonia solani 123E]|uniref:Uncharacterized protein n=1 Tax=Rhizoctonia solani 123E TaxID=1423351 RepID=A0A074S4K2_9AGAM|nr:hypothetical protein V565_325120 [Rhizoctonia solani 123E]
MLFGKAEAPVKCSSMEQIYAEYPDTILRFPQLRGFPLNDHWTFHAWLAYIPEHAGRWGKLRIPDGGDCIRCAAVVDPLSPYGKRDSSFVRYTFQKDANKNYQNLEPRMVNAFGYGRLDFIVALTLPPNKTFNIKELELHILAHITEARGAEGDAASELVSFTQFGHSVVLDVNSVLSVMGRVFTKGTKASGE